MNKKEFNYNNYDCEDDFINDLLNNNAIDLNLLNGIDWSYYDNDDKNNIYALGFSDLCNIVKKGIKITI